MVVDGKVDSKLRAELLDPVKIVFVRLGDQRLDAHLLGEFEVFPVITADAEIDHFHPGIGQFCLDLLALGGRHIGPHRRRNVPANSLAGEGFDVMQPQRRRLIDGFEKAEPIESVSLAAQPPADLLGVRCSRGRFGREQGRTARHRHSQAGDSSCA